MTSISHNLSGKIDEKTVAILSEIDAIARDLKIAFFILEREAASSQGHKIAMDLLSQDAFQKEPYEQVAEYFNALLRGLLD
jgi:hypothetical protein